MVRCSVVNNVRQGLMAHLLPETFVHLNCWTLVVYIVKICLYVWNSFAQDEPQLSESRNEDRCSDGSDVSVKSLSSDSGTGNHDVVSWWRHWPPSAPNWQCYISRANVDDELFTGRYRWVTRRYVVLENHLSTWDANRHQCGAFMGAPAVSINVMQGVKFFTRTETSGIPWPAAARALAAVRVSADIRTNEQTNKQAEGYRHRANIPAFVAGA